MIAGSVVPSALIRTWYETCSLILDFVHCGGNFGLPRGRLGSILTCPEVPDSQKGGSREYPYWLATAVLRRVARAHGRGRMGGMEHGPKDGRRRSQRAGRDLLASR